MYSSGQGLYIRLRGLFNNLDKVHMVYTGVNNITAGKTRLKLLLLRRICTPSCFSVIFTKETTGVISCLFPCSMKRNGSGSTVKENNWFPEEQILFIKS